MNTFSKIVIANRGEIAVRIIRTAKKMGVETVAIYTDSEKNALHVQMASQAFSLGNGNLKSTYLNINKIVAIAKESGAEAVHPGYGFLSENADFAEECEKNGIKFIGPSAQVLRQMGNKVTAKELACEAGIKVLAGKQVNLSTLEADCQLFNYPVLIKASFGGGGKGMQVVPTKEEMQEKATVASRSAENYFGNGELFIEEYVQNARHIEVQILADEYGNLVHLFERDCTLQRNHQKIIEEAPATALPLELRQLLHHAALKLCKKIGYTNAGTVEFLVDEKQQFFFLEMNPRIQVEHPVTEQITGIDIVKEQLSIAAGNKLSFNQEDIIQKGHSIEARIYAEDPLNEFRPSTKTLNFFEISNDKNFRIETDLTSNINQASTQFDPLLAKLIVTANSRENAIRHLRKALSKTVFVGTETNTEYLSFLVQHSNFKENTTSTAFCESIVSEFYSTEQDLSENHVAVVLAAAIHFLFPQKTEIGSTVWQQIGYWNPNTFVEMTVQQTCYQFNFQRHNNQIKLYYKGNEFKFNIIESEKHRLKLVDDQDAVDVLGICTSEHSVEIKINGKKMVVCCTDFLSYYPEIENSTSNSAANHSNQVLSTMHGKIIDIKVLPNQTITKGDLLLVIEAMKSENRVLAHKNAIVKKITVAVGDQVADNMPLIYLEDI